MERHLSLAIFDDRVEVWSAGTYPRGITAESLESQLGSELESKLESLDRRVLATVAGAPLGKGALAAALGQRQASGPLHQSVRTLARGLLEQTIPDKPNSRLQQYRITTAGKQILEQERT